MLLAVGRQTRVNRIPFGAITGRVVMLVLASTLVTGSSRAQSAAATSDQITIAPPGTPNAAQTTANLEASAVVAHEPQELASRPAKSSASVKTSQPAQRQDAQPINAHAAVHTASGKVANVDVAAMEMADTVQVPRDGRMTQPRVSADQADDSFDAQPTKATWLVKLASMCFAGSMMLFAAMASSTIRRKLAHHGG